MQDGFSLKDDLFNPETVAHLAGLFRAADPGFASEKFQADILSRFDELELKERIDWIADVLEQYLAADFPKAAAQIRAAMPAPLDPTKADDDFGHFIYAPLGVFVERHGLEDHRDLSLDLLEDLTQRFSMEFTIRAFLNRWPDETFQRFERWARHPHYHVRRLVSEGSRPKLPWGKSIMTDPLRPLPLLDVLHADPTRYVTRSVANHLNDIAKIAPDLVCETLTGWKKEKRQKPKELDWMTRHALRSLVKQGYPAALKCLGYRPNPKVTLQMLMLHQREVPMGDALDFEVELTAARREPVIVDYEIGFRKADGSRKGKVFKLKVAEITPDRPLSLKKRHVFKANAATFKLFPGAQSLTLLVNGKRLGEAEFALT